MNSAPAAGEGTRPTPRRLARLSLLCCAATDATRRAAFADDEAADPRSLARAVGAAPRLPADAKVLTSPAHAARQTADALGHDAEPAPLMRDVDWGRWRGRTLDEIAVTEPDALAVWLADPEASPHGGESLAQVLDRVAAFLTAGLDRPLLAITHATIVRAALIHVLAAPATSLWRVDVPPLARLDLAWNGHAWTLRQLATIPT